LQAVLGRRVYRSANSHSGEFEDTRIRVTGPRCDCGARGCLKTFTNDAATQ
jgi:predicted NBD/HSP70 family sugar kinase